MVQSNRLGNDISFSEAGGVDIEENWDKVRKITLDTEETATTDSLAPLLSSLPLELRFNMEAFIQACYEASPESTFVSFLQEFGHGQAKRTVNMHLTVLEWVFQVFLDLDFTLMEMNPFTLDSEGKPFPLDMRGELDDTAAFKSGKK